MKEPVASVARLLAQEALIERGVPVVLAGLVTYAAAGLLGSLSPAAPLSPLELSVALGAPGALAAWATARQRHLSGARDPRRIALAGVGAAFAVALSLAQLAPSSAESACEELGGAVEVVPVLGAQDRLLCRLSAVEGSATLVGVTLRGRWAGELPLPYWALLTLCGGVTALGARDRRILRTTLPIAQAELLRLLPAVGLGGALGEPVGAGGVQACGNRTWWGTRCGQLYSAERRFAPGEWCVRCRLPFTPSPTLRLDVVAPASDDVVLLNGLERVDSTAWTPGTPMRPPDASVSGAARWVQLGSVELPSVLPFSVALAILHQRLPSFMGQSPERDEVIRRAMERASRVSAWLWTGEVADRLHLATPTRSVSLVTGAVSLGELASAHQDRLTVQLELGVLPLEIRAGYVHHLLPETRRRLAQERGLSDPEAVPGSVRGNLRYVIWVPTTPEETPAQGPGVWIPRVEGAALRRWLEDLRLRPPGDDDKPAGATEPAPYLPFTRPDELPARLVVAEPADAELVSALVAAAASASGPLTVRQGEPDGGTDLLVQRVRGEDELQTLLRRRHAAGPPALAALCEGAALAQAARDGGAALALRWPIEPDDPEALVTLARDAAVARSLDPNAYAAAGAPAPHQDARLLDFHRRPLRGERARRPEDEGPYAWEPVDADEAGPWSALGEWDWFELHQLTQLRRGVLVAVAAEEAP